MPLIKHTAISRTADRALEEFSDSFRGALALAEPELWAANLGLVLITDAMKTTFPIPLDSVGYKEFRGDIKYRSLYGRSLSMRTKKWTDGVEERADVIESDQFSGWADQPGKMAMEWRRMPNTLAASVLESNPVLDFYRDPDTQVAGSRALFADDHPYNVLLGSGSFDNDRSTTVADILSGKFFEDAAEYYAGILGPNGQPMGLTLDGGTVLVSLKRNELFKKALEQDTVVTAIKNTGEINPGTPGTAIVAGVTQNNRHKGTVKRQLARELTSTSDNYFYTFASGNEGAHPFVIMQNASLEEIVCDKSSQKYADHLKVSVAEIGDANVSAALPHVICRWTISG